MTTRILPLVEYPKLAGTLLEQSWPYFDPDTKVIVVEDTSDIVGCIALFPVWHLDGAWIAPAWRGRTSVARRLLHGIRTTAADLGIHEVAMMTMTPETRRLCEHLGVTQDLTCHHTAVVLR